MVEFANKATVAHQIEALAKVGVTDIVLAVGFQPDQMVQPIKEFEKQVTNIYTYSSLLICCRIS